MRWKGVLTGSRAMLALTRWGILVSVEGSLSKTTSWPVWVGDQQEFARIVSVMERQFAPLIQPAVDETIKRPTEALRRAQGDIAAARKDLEDTKDQAIRELVINRIDRLQDSEQRAVAEIASYEEEARKWFNFTLRVTEPDGGERTFRGTGAQIAEVFDGLRFKTFSLDVTSHYMSDHRISLSANRTYGLTLIVSSRDEHWARAALGHLQDEIKRQVPWWKWLRNPIAMYLVMFAVVWTGIWIVVARVPDSSGSVVLWGCGAIAACAVIALLIHKYHPAVEILRSGQRAKGAGFVIAVIGLIVSIPVGLLVNWMSS